MYKIRVINGKIVREVPSPKHRPCDSCALFVNRGCTYAEDMDCITRNLIYIEVKNNDYKPQYESPNIRVTDAVRIVDGSYMLTVENGNLTDYSSIDGFPGLCKDIFIVAAINTPVPTGYTNVCLEYQNNCIIVNSRTGVQWFCSSINIKKV